METQDKIGRALILYFRCVQIQIQYAECHPRAIVAGNRAAKLLAFVNGAA